MIKFNRIVVSILIFYIAIYNSFSQKIDLTEIKAEDQFRWGVRAFHNGFYNKAILAFEKSISIKPESVLPRIWLGRAYYKSGYVNEALKEWREVVSAGGGNELLRIKSDFLAFKNGLGKELLRKGRYVLSNEVISGRGNYYPFKRPTSVTSAPDGSSYLVCFGSNEILKIDVNDKIESILKGGLEGFDHPFDIIRMGRFLYVSEYEGNRISKYDVSGRKLNTFGSKGSGPGELLGPQFLATDGLGYLYVTDWGNGRVSKYDENGNFILSFSDHLTAPTGIAIKDGMIYVADGVRKRIVIFDLNGNYLKSIQSKLLNKPEGMSFERNGNLLIADTDKIVEYQTKDEKWRIFGNPEKTNQRITDVSENPNGDILVTDFNNDGLYYFSEISSLYSSLNVSIERIDSIAFPQIIVDISVEDKYGNPVVGLKSENFHVSESYRDVENLEMVSSNTDEKELDIVILTDNSLKAKEDREEVKKLLDSLYKEHSGKVSMSVVSTEDLPVLRGEDSLTRLKLIEAAISGRYSESWRFDLGLRMAVSHLIPKRGKKGIIFISSGSLGRDAFKEYSLENLANYMKNNYIGFYPVYLHENSGIKELTFLSEETGGDQYEALSPLGIKGIFEKISDKIDPIYVFSYNSASEPEFGRKYIEVETMVTLQKRGGREVSGYYAPLK